MNQSIRKRLLYILLTATALVYVVTTAKSYYDSRHEISELLDAQLAQSAHALLALSVHELFEQLAYDAQQSKSNSVSRKITPQVHKYEQPVAFQIWLSGEQLAVRSENAPLTPLAPSQDIFQDQVIDRQHWRVYSLWNEERTIQVHVGELSSVRESLADQLAMQNITSFVLSLPLLAVLIWLGVGHAMDPLKRIAREVSGREFDNLKSLGLKGVPLEAKPLVEALNGLFHRLQISFDNIRNFTANAAHELRTPLAALKTHAQVGRAQPDYEGAIQGLDFVIDDANRAIHLVEQMLTIARLDPESHLLKMEDVDLCLVAQEEMAMLGVIALDKDISLDLECNCRHLARGKEALIGTLIRNLVSNAIRYINTGGHVRVLTRDENDGVMVRIEDDGPGLPEDQREKVFERFYRYTDNRNESNGSGLGLSIVKRIVELHQAEIKLGQSAMGGLQVDVYFKTGSRKSERRPREKAGM